jgi:multidrug efflux pump subunit AcrA (membrane-fusion protein)
MSKLRAELDVESNFPSLPNNSSIRPNETTRDSLFRPAFFGGFNIMKYILIIATLALVAVTFNPQANAQSGSQATPSAHRKPAKPHKPTLQDQLFALQKEMHDRDEKFQEELDLLKAQLAAKQTEAEAATQTAQAARQKAADVQVQVDASAQQSTSDIQQLRETVDTATVATQSSIAQAQTQQAEIKKQMDTPESIHYKGVTLTPGGFLAGESIWRQHAMNADIYTNFNATPFPGAGEAYTSEWVPSARQSRLSLLGSGKVPFGYVRGLFEGDFLSAGITSNNLQSNSYTLRIRQAWAQAEAGRFTFTAGQMWTLLTENKKQALPGQEALPLIFDGNAHVGFTYIRQMGYRLQDVLAPGITIAVALENSQYQFSASNAPSNFFFGNAGAAGGLNNPSANYTNQIAPDVLAKVSFDSAYGHYEIGGVARFFRDRYYPNGTTSAGAQNDTELGGGLVANARFPVTGKAAIGLHLVAGDGTGRYGASLLPDVTVKPNGTLEPLRNAQGMFSLEIYPTKKLDMFGYAGTEYVQRTYYRNSAGALVGYAPPSASNSGCFVEAVPTGGTGYAPGTGTCLGATRMITQGSVGYVYRIYSGPAGKLQYGFAYSYLIRDGWYGIGGAPKATNNFVYTSFRYYLP